MGAFLGKYSAKVAPSRGNIIANGFGLKNKSSTRKVKKSPPKKSTTRRTRSPSEIELEELYPQLKSRDTNYSNRL